MARRGEEHHYSYILMKDAQGEKACKGIVSFIFGSEPKDIQVLRGELLIKISINDIPPTCGGKPAHNFYLKRDPSITLYGGEDDRDVTPLDKSDNKLLEAIQQNFDRFAILCEGDKLEWGGKLRKGDQVYVKLTGSNSSVPTWSLAVVQYVGEVEHLPGTLFGVVIKDPQYYGRVSMDGFFQEYQYFNCEEDCGLFVSLDKLSLQPNPPNIQTTKQGPGQLTNSPLLLKRSSCPSECDSYELSTLPQTGSHRDLCQIQHDSNNCKTVHGNWTAVNLTCTCTLQEDQSPGPNPHSITQVPNLLLNSNTLLPMESSLPPERNYSQGSIPLRMDSSPAHLDFSLEVGTLVQLPTTDPNNPFHYGTIRWIGNAGQSSEQVAGIELEEYNVMDGCNDGTFPVTGIKYFDCPSGHDLYFPLASLRPDERFASGADTSTGGASNDNPLQAPMEEETDQHIDNTSQQLHKYLGEWKGIQGHYNSCFLDATVFGLFALSNIFDNAISTAKHTNDENRIVISELLWKGIVNPLRKNGVVRFESVMKFRNKLEELGKMEGITEKEKDPEEFLNMLLKHSLQATPFFSIRRPFGVEEEFFVQLFVEFDSSLKIPTIEKLLKKMFIEQNISFTKTPSKLLIQVPRFGKRFKTYQKIVPDLKPTIKEIIDSSAGVDNKKEDHLAEDVLSDLDLLSVICIETSHYVCFTRDHSKNKWIFFDSMSDRLNDTYNVPKVTDCTDLLNDWVYPLTGDRTRLMDTPPRQLPELVRRFTQDVYMCVYIQPEVAMYGTTDLASEKGPTTLLQVDTHLQPLKDALWEARSKWKDIGRALYLGEDTIDSILDLDDGESLDQVLKTWIQSGEATTLELVFALEDETVNCTNIANQIRTLKGKIRTGVGL